MEKSEPNATNTTFRNSSQEKKICEVGMHWTWRVVVRGNDAMKAEVEPNGRRGRTSRNT